MVQDRFPGHPPGDVRKLHLLEARDVGGAYSQIRVQQPLDLVEYFEQKVPADVVLIRALPPCEYQLVLRRVRWPAWVGCLPANTAGNVTSGSRVRPSASSGSRSREAGQPFAAPVPVAIVWRSRRTCVWIKLRETDARHRIGRDISSAPLVTRSCAGARSRERRRVLSNPYPRDPVCCRVPTPQPRPDRLSPPFSSICPYSSLQSPRPHLPIIHRRLCSTTTTACCSRPMKSSRNVSPNVSPPIQSRLAYQSVGSQ